MIQKLATEEVLAFENRATSIDDDWLAPSGTAITRLVDRVTASVTVPDAAAARRVVRRLEAAEG